MRTRHASLLFLALLASAVFSCITVNIYFPEAAVKKAAAEIVDEVRKQNAESDSRTEPDRGPQASVSGTSAFSLVPAAYAQEETSVSTPAIRAIKQSLKDRFPSLKSYYDNGHLGENADGFVEVRDESALSLKDKAALRSLVKDENGDREKLYAEVAKALGIESGQVSRVQKIFAENWMRNAAPGWWVQKDDGGWIKKP